MSIRPGWAKQAFSLEEKELSESRIRRQIDGVEKLLGLKFRNRILDLGCGAGSQTLELARRRYRVVGMESSDGTMAAAREKAKSESLTVHFLKQDFRRIPYEAEFNAVLNLRNPLGSGKDDRYDRRCLESIRRSLKAGGKLLLDLINREWLLRRLGEDARAFDLAAGRLQCRGFLPRGGAASAQGALRLYSLTEMIALLASSGMRFEAAYGDYEGKPYDLESCRMIVVAERGPEPKAAEPKEDDGLERAVRIKGRPRF